jgi:hypothetical protein
MAYQAVRNVLELQQEQLARSSQHAAVVQEAANVLRKAKDSGAKGSSSSNLGDTHNRSIAGEEVEERVLFTIPCAPTPNRLPPSWPPCPFEAQTAARVLHRAILAATRVHDYVAHKRIGRALRRWLVVSSSVLHSCTPSFFASELAWMSTILMPIVFLLLLSLPLNV